MTKVYKAIKSNELETYTNDGWTWDGIDRHEQQVMTAHDDTGRYMTADERKAAGFRDYDSPSKIYDHKKFFGDVLIFIVWKDQEQISRENAAENRARNAEFKLQQLNNEATQHAKQIEKLTTERENAQKLANERQQTIWARDDKNRTLEDHIAKIRTAIGTERMNEILGVKKS